MAGTLHISTNFLISNSSLYTYLRDLFERSLALAVNTPFTTSLSHFSNSTFPPKLAGHNGKRAATYHCQLHLLACGSCTFINSSSSLLYNSNKHRTKITDQLLLLVSRLIYFSPIPQESAQAQHNQSLHQATVASTNSRSASTSSHVRQEPFQALAVKSHNISYGKGCCDNRGRFRRCVWSEQIRSYQQRACEAVGDNETSPHEPHQLPERR